MLGVAKTRKKEEDLIGKRPLGWHRLRWEDVVKKNGKALRGSLHWSTSIG